MKNKTYIIGAILILIAILSFIPVIQNLKMIFLNDDFLQLATRHYIIRDNIITHHELPLRTHFFGGGFPSISDPEDPVFSPSLWLTLVFGEIAGLKVLAFLLLLTGAVFGYALARKIYGYTVSAAFITTAVLTFSAWFPIRFVGGNVNELYYFLTPAILYFFESWVQYGKNRYLIPAVLLIGITAADGELVFPCIIIFVVVYSILRGIGMRDVGHYPRKAVILTVFVFLVAAVKILLVFELFNAKGSVLHPTIDMHEKMYSAQTIHAMEIPSLINIFRWDEGEGEQTENLSYHIGLTPFLLLIFSVVRVFRKNIFWLCITALFLWISAAYTAPVDIFRILWQLPWFNTINAPAKYFNYFIVFCLAYIIGNGINEVSALMSKHGRLYFAFIALISILTFIPLLKITYDGYHSINYSDPPVRDVVPDEFCNAQLMHSRDNIYMYFNTLKNRGTLNWYGAIKLGEYAIPKMFIEYSDTDVDKQLNPSYRGEAFFLNPEDGMILNGNTATVTKISANQITVTAEARTPGLLVLNHNYHKYWKCSQYEITNTGGLIGINLTAPGNYRIQLGYKHRYLLWYLLISLAGLTGLLYYGLFFLIRKPH